jgi:hypothetical protein
MTVRSRVAIVLVAALAVALVPAAVTAAKKKKGTPPQVELAVAVYEEADGTVRFGVNVEGAERVDVSFEGVRQNAVSVHPSDHWWDVYFPGALRDCYRIVVHAANADGSVDRAVGAGRLGTAGCASCDEAEHSRAIAQHKVKRARAHLRNADSAEERRKARRHLRRANRRLDRAEQLLAQCQAQRAGEIPRGLAPGF